MEKMFPMLLNQKLTKRELKVIYHNWKGKHEFKKFNKIIETLPMQFLGRVNSHFLDIRH